jgi:hypothetical protein
VSEAALSTLPEIWARVIHKRAIEPPYPPAEGETKPGTG